jgi:dihydroorotase
MVIDAHVHLRDFNEKYKETVKHGLEVALDSGVSAVFEMPNTDPPIIDEKTVEDRLKLYKEADVKDVFCGMYIGLTSDPEQIKNAVEISRKYFPLAVGMKLYAGTSVGNLAVVHPIHQQTAYIILAQEGYEGVLAVHAEKELLMNQEVFLPRFPISHCFARPPMAEYASIKDQITFAKLTKFKGKLHITHISSPESVELVNKAKESGLDISCSTCPHYFMLDMNKLLERDGLLWKMNPALRPGKIGVA